MNRFLNRWLQNRLTGWLAVLFLPFVAVSVSAAPITYTVQDTALGTLGGVAFNGQITLAFQGDTDNASAGASAGLFRNAVGTATITTPVGNAIFSGDAFFVTANQNIDPTTHPVPSDQIGDFTLNRSILGTASSSLATYDLRSPISPVTGAAVGNVSISFPTTMGGLMFTAFGPTSTFTAITTLFVQGGTPTNPTEFAGSVGSVSGTIGGVGSVDFYRFDWSGGLFGATAAVFGATPPENYAFELFAAPAFLGAPPTLLRSLTLDGTNAFKANFSQMLVPGRYDIGLIADSPTDPMFAITFDTPVDGTLVEGTLVPEPETYVMLLAGLGLLGFVARRRTQRTISEP